VKVGPCAHRTTFWGGGECGRGAGQEAARPRGRSSCGGSSCGRVREPRPAPARPRHMQARHPPLAVCRPPRAARPPRPTAATCQPTTRYPGAGRRRGWGMRVPPPPGGPAHALPHPVPPARAPFGGARAAARRRRRRGPSPRARRGGGRPPTECRRARPARRRPWRRAGPGGRAARAALRWRGGGGAVAARRRHGGGGGVSGGRVGGCWKRVRARQKEESGGMPRPRGFCATPVSAAAGAA
jgi:hypothetical protein